MAAIADQATGVHDEYFDPNVVAEWHERADEVYAVAVDAGVATQPLMRRDLVRIVRTCLFGHLPIPEDGVIDRRPWGAHEFELAADFRAPNHKSRLEVSVIDDDTGEDRKTYLSTLVATGWPDAIRFAKNARGDVRSSGWTSRWWCPGAACCCRRRSSATAARRSATTSRTRRAT